MRSKPLIKPLSFFLRNFKIVRKVDYVDYTLYELFNGNEIILLECREGTCVENSVIPFRKNNKFH